MIVQHFHVESVRVTSVVPIRDRLIWVFSKVEADFNWLMWTSTADICCRC